MAYFESYVDASYKVSRLGREGFLGAGGGLKIVIISSALET